jgi:hypothetical protein
MTSVWEMVRKYFCWGLSLATLFQTAPQYQRLTRAAVSARLHRGAATRGDYYRSLTLLGLKSVPYTTGYICGWIRVRRARLRRRPAITDQ